MKNRAEVDFGKARLDELLTEVAKWAEDTKEHCEIDSISLEKTKGEFWSCRVFYHYIVTIKADDK